MRLTQLIRIVVFTTVVLFLLATWPQLLAMHQLPILAQLTAMRGLMVASATVGMLAFSVTAALVRSWRRFGVLIVGALVVVITVNSALLISRGLSSHVAHAEADPDLTVFIWNTYRDSTAISHIAEIAIEHDVDVIVLLEASASSAAKIVGQMEAVGQPMQTFVNTFHESSSVRYTVLLVSTALGPYVVDESAGSTPRVPTVMARPVSGQGPTLIAGHAAPPLPFIMQDWAAGLGWLAERCREGNVIIAGDFNATLDHFAGLRVPDADIGACRDGALAMGSAGLGTWPSWLPAWLGSPIDHIVASREWEFIEFRVVLDLDGLGSDHRALLAGLRRR